MFDDEFRLVYDVVVRGRYKGLDKEVKKKHVYIAKRNKVLLQFLRTTNVKNDIRLHEEVRYKRYLKNLKRVNMLLDGLDYLYVKLYKPVEYVPADIDILVKHSEIYKVVDRLSGKGYRVDVVEPYCITMVDEDIIVDLYIFPTLAGIIYLDVRDFTSFREYVVFNGMEIPVLRPFVEALLTVVHAIYKERIYTLNDYITVTKWFNKDSLKLAMKLKCINAVIEAFKINRLVDRGVISLPYRIPLARWIVLLAVKFINDEYSRGTSLNLLRSLKDVRIGKHIISKMTRESY